MERPLAAELTNHLGSPPHLRATTTGGNTQNGANASIVQMDHGPIELTAPRDRAGTCDPAVVKKQLCRLVGFGDKVLALYAHGLTTREIQWHLEELYGIEVSPTLISAIQMRC